MIDETRSWATRTPLPPDIHAILDGPPRVEIGGPIPEPRFVITMAREQAATLQRWRHGLHDSLKHDDERRLICLLCISRVAVAIMLSERS